MVSGAELFWWEERGVKGAVSDTLQHTNPHPPTHPPTPQAEQPNLAYHLLTTVHVWDGLLEHVSN